jgi:ketosteroid isomerase-like protein
MLPSERDDDAEAAGLAGNARIAWSFFAALRDGRFNEALDLLDDSGTHWGGSFPYQDHPLAGFKAKLRLVEQGVHDTPMGFILVDCIAQGDRVVLELRNDGMLPDGRPYEMVYCFILRIRDGRIASVREYADTAYNRDVRPEMYSKQSAVYRALRDQGLTTSTFDSIE